MNEAIDKALAQLAPQLEQNIPKLPPKSNAVEALVAVAENAVDASPDNATVVLQASAVDGLRLVEFRIEDAGPGISPAIRERIFEPFFTTKTSGTGLGLAIARGIVLGHEGRIQFHDRPGGGTIALVHIPLQVTRGDHRAPDPGLSLE